MTTRPLLSDEEIMEAAEAASELQYPIDDSDGSLQLRAEHAHGYYAGARFARDHYEAAMQRERECREKLVEALERFLAAADDSCDASPDHDDIAAMLEYGDADKALRAALAAAEERSAPEVCEDTLEEKIADHQRDMDEEVWGGDL